MSKDIATILGFFGSFAVVIMAILIGAGLPAYIDIPSILIVGIGSLFVAMMKFGLKQFAGAFKVAAKAFVFQTEAPTDLIKRVVELAEKARKEGIVALEEEPIENEFLKAALKRMADNVDPDILRTALTTDMLKTVERHETGKKIFDAIGDVAPAMGMIGTLVGLVAMLLDMSDPSAIGPSMAVALLTTLYGAVIANMVALPIADKLALRSQEERDNKMLLIEAISGIQEGVHPRVLQESLLAFLPASARAALSEEAT